MNKLFYKELGTNIVQEKEFKKPLFRLYKIQDIVIGSRQKVFMLKIDYADAKYFDIYVFENWRCIRFLDNTKYNNKYYIFHLYEFDTYKEAYLESLNIISK